MSRYRYKAIAANGEIVVGHLAAETREAAIDILRQRGVVPLAAEADTSHRRTRLFLAGILRTGRIDQRDVLAFTQQLSTLLSAGVPLDLAIDRLAEARQDKPYGRVLRAVSADVKSGKTLAGAMGQLPNAFPSFYVGMVRAGEAAGTLPSVLNDVAAVMQNSQDLRDKVVSSLLYPLIVLALVAGSFLILMAWVIPEFRPLMERRGADLPLSATVILFLSTMIVEWGWLIALCLGAGGLMVARLAATGRLRHRIGHLLIRIPYLGGAIRQLESARYCRSLGTLLSNGMPLVEAVGIANDAVTNSEIKTALASTKASLSRGVGLAGALTATGAIPPMPLQIVEAGEQSGDLGRMLLLAANTCQGSAQRMLERSMTLLAPIVTVALGVIVAAIIGSILTAMLSTYELPI